MSFNMGVIPPENRSEAHVSAHVQLWKESQDTIRVYNPTDEDFIVKDDYKVTGVKWIIPNKNKDVGFGKGYFELPRFAANRYKKHMGIKIITEISKKDWDVRKKEIPTTERGNAEETAAIRTNDPAQWKLVLPIIWKGVVRRYAADVIDELEPEPQHQFTGNVEDDALNELGLNDMSVEAVEETKANLLKELV